MKKKLLYYIVLFAFAQFVAEVGNGQHFTNASFEGPAPAPHTSPPAWALCDGTPDTQPGVWDVPTPPSEGVSYVGMCWSSDINYDEMISTQLIEPFYADSCYKFEIDLAYYHQLNWYGIIEANYPITIRIYGSDYLCTTTTLLWTSPYIENTEWQTFSFLLEPDQDIATIAIQTYSVYNPLPHPANIGYILMDNIRITSPPPLELGPDTTICNDTILLCVGNGFETLVWQDGSTDSCYKVTEPGIYWVEAYTDYDCMVSDTIEITGGISFELQYDSTLFICQGDSIELNAGEGFEEYFWNTGEEDSLIVVNSPGVYWVKVINSEGCEGIDSVYVDNYPPVHSLLNSDTLLCANSILILDAGPGFESYQWYDNSTEQTNIINEMGVYWVTVEDEHGCLETDTVHVDLSPPVFVTLGGDTSICAGNDFTLSPGSGFVEYLWQNGSTESFLEIINPGTFWVQVVDENGCSGADTVQVGLYPSPDINLGPPDTTICEGETLILDAGSFASYLWQDNSTNSEYFVYESGYYSVTVSNNYNCQGSDDIIVNIGSPEINIGPDTSLCYTDSIYLRPGEGFAYYEWQDGSNESSYHVTTSGIYSVFVQDEFGCSDEDNVELVLVLAPTVDLGEDQEMCSGNSITLEAPVGPYTYFWNGIEGTATFKVTTGGECTVQLVNMCGDANDSIYIEEIETPYVDLGSDVLLNPDESIELDAGFGFDTYLWQDGSTNQFFLVNADNINSQDPDYFVEVSTGPCKGSDTVEVYIFIVELPIVFTPNNDGKNDLFLPMENSWNGITKHHISIFNRWGEQVWESESFEDGWDGKQNGITVADGTYFWVLEVFYGPEDLKQTLKGSLSVLGGN